ncbi:DUF3572 domain-containing protein [Tabrizicola sp.]|uniref:DUF3572 domain-containing protein n=1 Tax=Tabrizicola sp. TaxID=2005166 RepID=UPI00286C0C62|nr:DUF3572 domain-containing protein [Tabrizicola sp.]
MQRESAQIVALQVLGWLAADDEMFQSFLGATGAGPSDVAMRAEDAEFHAAILDFLLLNDAWVVSFCDAVGLPYTVPMSARVVLHGDAQMDWT